MIHNLKIVMLFVSIVGSLAVATLIVAGTFHELADATMEPNFLPGDVVWSRPLLGQYIPKRGDVVLLEHEGQRLIRRVVGLPGDLIRLEQHELTINDAAANLQEDYETWDELRHQLEASAIKKVFKESILGSEHKISFLGSAFARTPLGGKQSSRPGEVVAVPVGHLYVLGDSRDVAQDSRHFGTVRLANVYGLVTAILYNRPPGRVASYPANRIWKLHF